MTRILHRPVRAKVALMLLLGAGSPISSHADGLIDPMHGADGNMLVNGGLEATDSMMQPFRWSVAGEAVQAVITTKQKHSGRGCLELTDASATLGTTVRSEARVAISGTRYEATAWVRGVSGTPASFSLEFWDKTRKLLSSETVPPTFNAEWQMVQLAALAPPETTRVTVAITSSLEAVGVSDYDDVSLVMTTAYNPKIGRARELFGDDYRIESTNDIGRVVHPGTKRPQPVLRAEKPWETTAYIYGSVIQDPVTGHYKMWYTSFCEDVYYLCYATSTNGLKWVKPELGLVDFKGSKANNIVLVGGGTVLFDPSSTDPARRYKAMSFSGKPTMGYYGFVSPDGLHWTRSETPLLPYGDVSNLAYDPFKRQLIATTKQRMFTSITPGTIDRAVFVSTSTDGLAWTTPQLVIEGDAADDAAAVSRGMLEAQIYGMPVYPYEGIYLGFPWVFDISDYQTGVYAAAGNGPIQPQLASSRDLLHWSRPVRSPVLPIGEPGAWDDSMIFTSTTFQTTPREVRVYYGGFSVGHGGGKDQHAHIGLASWRRDGFVSLHNNGDDIGTITTKPLVFQGRQLKVNANLGASGSLKVEILNVAGVPLSGYTLAETKSITGDQYEATVKWQNGGDVSRLAGQSVKLRFHLQKGDLYSYWFAS